MSNSNALSTTGVRKSAVKNAFTFSSSFGAPCRGLQSCGASPGLVRKASGTLRTSSANTAEPRAPPDTPLRTNIWSTISGQES